MNGFVDLHCHIFPTIDDGSKSWDMTRNMLEQAVADGTSTICWTPHLMNGEDRAYFLRVAERFAEGVEKVREWGLPLRVELGGEIYLMPDIAGILGYPCGSYRGLRTYSLVEFPMYEYHPNYANWIQRMKQQGITIVLAHPERYIKIQDSWSEYERLHRAGAVLQINAGSIRGDFGETTKKVAKRLIQKGLASLVASDGHNDDSRPLGLRSAYEQVKSWSREAYAIDLFCRKPAEILGL